MAPAPATSRSTHFSAATIIGAIVVLLGIAGALTYASANVKESTARELANKVVAGNISVIGTAKVRRWQGEGFTIQVPAGWPLIADGASGDCGASEDCLANHVWQGTGDASKGASSGSTTCIPEAICVQLAVIPPKDVTRAAAAGNANVERSKVAGGRTSVRDAWSFQFQNQLTNADNASRPRYLDYGGVTAKGGRWVARAQARVGQSLQTSYVFATCRPGRLGSPPGVDRYWELRLTAPSDAVPTFQFYDILASLRTDLRSPGEGQDCSFAVAG